MKSIEEINEKINHEEAIILTAEEFKKRVREGKDVSDVDVVTTATCGIMSGTAAILTVPVSEKGEFDRAKMVWLNDIPALPGPCPNERLGLVDLIIYGTSHSVSKPEEYGAGHLFRDFVEKRSINVKVETNDNRIIENSIELDNLDYARILTTRVCFKNYSAFVNTKEGEVKSIFSVLGLEGPYKEVTVSGCGEINPLENDPDLKAIGIGTKILVNGSIGYIIGKGTRSKAKPNLSVIADMFSMEPEFMGGFKTSFGPECITSIAVPIPVLDEDILTNLKILDENTVLPIADINDRTPFTEGNYGEVWKDKSLEVTFDYEKCVRHDDCFVEEKCPTKAFLVDEGIDKKKCFNCGSCMSLCPDEAFFGNLGSIRVNDRDISIRLRQSNRYMANLLALKLKEMIVKKEFLLSSPVGQL